MCFAALGFAAVAQTVPTDAVAPAPTLSASGAAPGVRALEFTPDERAWLASHPEITLTIDDDYSPRNFRSRGGELIGISVDYIQLLASYLGIRIRLEGLPWSEALERAMRHEVDGVVNADQLSEREKYLAFTDVYVEYPQAVLVRQDSAAISRFEDLAGLRVAVKENSSQLAFLRDKYPSIERVPVGSVGQGVDLLTSENVDAVYDDLAVLHQFVSERFLNNVKFGLVTHTPPVGFARIGLRNDVPQLLSCLNKAIAAITDEDRRIIQDKWLDLSVPEEVPVLTQETVALSAEEKAWLAAHPSVTIWTDLDTPPYIFRDAFGQPQGVLRDLADRIGQILGIRFDFVGESYSDLIGAVRDGAADVTVLNDPLDAPYQERYLKTKDFLHLPYSLWVRRDSPLLLQDKPTLIGKTIVLNSGWDLQHPFLRQFEGANFITRESVHECTSTLLRGDADAYIEVYSIIADFANRNVVGDLKVAEIYTDGCPAAFFVRKDWAEFHGALEKALEILGGSELRGILIKWNAHVTDPSARVKMIELTEDEREWLRDHPVVRVAADSNWAPIEFCDSDRRPLGIAADYLSRLEEIVGVHFEIVNQPRWQDVLDRLKDGSVDMASCVADTPQRREYLTFTPPYLILQTAIFARDDSPYLGSLENLKGKRVGVLQGEAIQEYLSSEYPELQIVPAESVAAAIRALARREVDAYVGGIAVTSYYIGQTGLTQIKVAGETPYEYPMAMGVPKDSTHLLSILTKALNALNFDERNAIYQKWVSVKYERPFDYTLILRVAAAVLAILVLVLVWNRRLAALVRHRTRDLSVSNEQLRVEVEERKRTEVALRESEELFRTLFNLSPSVCALSDMDGIYRYVNEAFCRSNKVSRSDVLGKSMKDLGIIPLSTTRESLVAKLSEQGALENSELTVRLADGHQADLLVSSKLINLAGEEQILSVAVDITERKRVEEALRTSEERYRLLFNAATDAVLIMDGFTFIDCNDSALAIFGCTKADIIGKSPFQFSPPVQPNGIPSEVVGRQHVEKVISGEAVKFEWRHERLDGSQFDAEVGLNAVELKGEPQLLAIVRDITERKRGEELLRDSEARLHAIFDSVGTGILVSGVATKAITYANPAAAALIGLPRDSLVGLCAEDISCPVGDALHTNGDFEREPSEREIVAADGRRIPVLRTASRTLIGGQDQLLESFIDLTPLKQAEADRVALEAQFRQAQKMEAVGQLAGGVAHDFNNLLQAIIGYGELVQEQLQEGDRFATELEEMIKAARRAAILVRQLLAFSRRQMLELTDVNLNEVVDNLAKMIRRVIGEHITLTVRTREQLPNIRADRGQVEQILINLCVNSRDAMPQGGDITVETYCESFDEEECRAYTWARPGTYAVVSVADTGVGMDEETKAHIFEPFFTTKSEGRGTGLGLATVYGIVRQHNGIVAVYSEVGKGTTFRVYFPVSEAMGGDAPERVTAASGGVETILLAEDEENVRRLAQRVLEMAGYTVYSVANGEDALKMYQRHESQIQLLVLDVVMPGLGGRAVFERIRALNPSIRVLFASGYSAGAIDSNFVLDEGMQLIQKPFHRADLLTRVRQVLDASNPYSPSV